MNFATLNPSEYVKLVHSLEAEVRTATANGAAVDCRGFAQAIAIISLGTISAGSTATVTVQQSSDNDADAFTLVTGASYTLTGSDDDTVKGIAIRLHGKERYLRAVYTEVATGESSAISVAFALLGPQDSANDQSFTYSADVL